MKLFITAIAVTLISLAITMSAGADRIDVESHIEEETVMTVDHYEGVEVKTNEQALTTLKEYDMKIAKILIKEPSSIGDLEEIHQLSYSLENAVDFLIKAEAYPLATLEAVDEAIQAMHYASEKHEEGVVREWHPKYSKAVANLSKDTTAVASNEDGVYNIYIKDHKFTPEEIHAPQGKKLKLIVHNQDSTPEEFESDDFRREKIIAGNTKATIYVGPLKPGKYHYFGEFNLDTANGYLYVE